MRKLVVGFVAAAVCISLSRLAQADAISQSQVSAMARQLETAIREGKVDAAVALYDQDAMVDRALAGVGGPAALEQGFRAGLKRTSPIGRALGEIAKTGSYHLLRVRQVNGECRALFRLITQQNGLNYHDWVAGMNSQGQLKFVDQYIGATGELMSQTLRRAYVMAAAHASPTLLQRLAGSDKDFFNNIRTMAQMGADVRMKNYKAALDVYATLPKSMQEDKTIMTMRLLAAQRVRKQDPSQYMSAMADFARLFPGDPCLDLVGLDFLIEERNFQDARDSLKRLGTFTGGDPYLGVLRGNIDLLEGGPANVAAARNEYETATIVEPMLAQAYWALVTLDLKSNDYDKAAAELTQIQQRLHIKIGPLEGKPIYAGFVQSDAYRKWKATQAANN